MRFLRTEDLASYYTFESIRLIISEIFSSVMRYTRPFVP